MKRERPRKQCNGLQPSRKKRRPGLKMLSAPVCVAASFLTLVFLTSPTAAGISDSLLSVYLPPAWSMVIIAVLLLAAYFVLFFLVFSLRGPLPGRGEPVTETAIPELLCSPAEAGYLYRLEYDDSCLVAALVHLAHQHIISISDHHLGWMIHRESPCPGTVAPEELSLFKSLFRKGPSMLLEEKGGGDFRHVKRDFVRFMNNHYGRRITRTRMAVFIPGAALAVMGGFAVSAAPGKSLEHIGAYSVAAAAVLFTGALIVTRPTSYANRGNTSAEALRKHLTTTQIPSATPEKTLLHFYAHLAHAIALDAPRWWITRNLEALHATGSDPADIETDWYTNGKNGLAELLSLTESLLKTVREIS